MLVQLIGVSGSHGCLSQYWKPRQQDLHFADEWQAAIVAF